MTHPSNAHILNQLAGSIFFTQLMDSDEKRDAIRKRLVEQASQALDRGVPAEALVYAAAPTDEQVQKIAKAIWNATAPGETFPPDIQIQTDEDRVAYRTGHSRLFAAMEQAPRNWEAQQAKLLDGLGAQIAAANGKQLANPEARQLVEAFLGGQAQITPDVLAENEIVVYHSSHMVNERLNPSELSIGMVDRNSIADSIQFEASLTQLIDASAKKRAAAKL